MRLNERDKIDLQWINLFERAVETRLRFEAGWLEV